MSKQTPSQTVGPFFAYGLTAQQYHYPNSQIVDGAPAPEGAPDRIRIIGRVLDGAGAPIPDALIEIWQADSAGRYGAEGFSGFGRQGTGTDPQSRFLFDTIKPGAATGHAPFLTLVVFMRGLLSHVYTRLYFSDESVANAADPTLATVPAERRQTLVAKRDETASGAVYRFDIRMQGEDETVFFDL
jgi:protocatechuate 3,4-dioxygenase, alpha subunit